MDISKGQELISNIGRIPPLNPVVLRLLEELSNGQYNATNLHKIIEEDANTSATILKIANSPFYGMKRQVNSIRDACVLLGFNSLRNIVYATAMESFTCNTGQESLRQHTVATAIIASQLARFSALDDSTCYTLGLLHELGKQITMVGFPDYFNAFLAKAKKGQDDMGEEIDSMCALGETMAKSWHLPDLFLHCIRYYTRPASCPKPSAVYVQLIHAAHGLANAMGYPSPGETVPADPQGERQLHLENFPPEASSTEVMTSIEQAIKHNLATPA